MKMRKLLTAAAFTLATGFAFGQHTVTMRSGTTQQGYVVEIQGGVLKLDADGGMQSIKVSDISMINFGSGDASGAGGSNEIPEKMAVSADGNYKIKYRMKERTIVKPPRMALGTQDKGIVVVNVTIDKYGNVQSARSGADGTNTDNDYLLTKAKQFAEEIKFDKVPTAPLETRGTVTFTF